MYILSQIFVVLSDMLYIASMLTKKKYWLLILSITNSALFSMHYFCLGEFTASSTIALSIIYLIIIFFMDKNNKEKYSYIPSLIFIGLTIILTILINDFSFGGTTAILSMFGIIAVYIAAIFKNLVIVKSFYLLGNILNFIVMIIIGSWFGASLSIIIMISAVIGIFQSAKLLKIKNQKTK